MNAEWVYTAVTGFGRHFGFEHFALGERGTAAADFENGSSVAIEYAGDVVCLMVRVPMEPVAVSLKKLLVAAHPDNRYAFPLRTAYLRKSSQALFLVKFNERDVTETSLWQVFEQVWSIAEGFGGAQWS